jgi:hypothetical protein
MNTSLQFSSVQFSEVRWSPLHINYRAGWNGPRGWLLLPHGWALSYGVAVDTEERLVWQWGRWLLTRPETPLEREEREEGEAEAAFMEYEANRYTEWSY